MPPVVRCAPVRGNRASSCSGTGGRSLHCNGRAPGCARDWDAGARRALPEPARGWPLDPAGECVLNSQSSPHPHSGDGCSFAHWAGTLPLPATGGGRARPWPPSLEVTSVSPARQLAGLASWGRKGRSPSFVNGLCRIVAISLLSRALRYGAAPQFCRGLSGPAPSRRVKRRTPAQKECCSKERPGKLRISVCATG